MVDSGLSVEQFGTAVHRLNAVKYFQLAAFVVLVYDHALTLDQEVARIWKRPLSGASILFYINRYITPLQFIIIINAFHDPNWTKEACQRFVAFEGASTVALIAVCQLLMILRIYALYARSNWVLSLLLFLWAGQIAVSSIGLTTGFPAPLPPGLVGCIFTSTSRFFPALWVAPLVTDSVIFILTLLRTRSFRKLIKGGTPTLHVFVRDGTIYFLVIFLANLMNTIIYFTAPEDLKAIGASFSQLITAAMVSRLVLNLRSLSTFEHFDSYIHETEIHGHHSQLRSGRSGIVVARDNFMTRTLNDLGDGEEEGDSLDGRGMELEVRVDNVVLRTVEGGGGEGEGEKARVEVVQMPVLPVRRREPVGSDSDAERGGLASTSTTEDKAPVAL